MESEHYFVLRVTRRKLHMQPASRMNNSMSSTMHRRATASIGIVVALWAAVVLVGGVILQNYANTPGQTGMEVVAWPQGSELSLDSDSATLVMFVHPRCPCSRASLNELSRLTSTCGDRLTTLIAIHQPASQTQAWVETTLQTMASEVPGAKVVMDVDGRESERFGAVTSGHVVLYGPQGNLMFSGGITASRGHEGNNAGRNAIERLVSGSSVDHDSTPVFGCPLIGPEESCCTKESP